MPARPARHEQALRQPDRCPIASPSKGNGTRACQQEDGTTQQARQELQGNRLYPGYRPAREAYRAIEIDQEVIDAQGTHDQAQPQEDEPSPGMFVRQKPGSNAQWSAPAPRYECPTAPPA